MPAIRISARALIDAVTTTPAANARAVCDGPVQVRTSTLAILTASFIPAVVFTLVEIPSFTALFGTWQAADWSAQILKTAITSYLCMIVVLITLLPAAAVAGITHALARSLQRRRGIDYAAIGAAVSFVTASMIYWYLPTTMLALVAILAGALMGAAYQRLAGLEPLSPSKAELATVPRHPAAGRHAARRGRAATING